MELKLTYWFWERIRQFSCTEITQKSIFLSQCSLNTRPISFIDNHHAIFVCSGK